MPSIRIFREKNLIPHLTIRFALLNVTTWYRTKYKSEDTEDADVWEFFKEIVPCYFDSCSRDSLTVTLNRFVITYSPSDHHDPVQSNAHHVQGVLHSSTPEDISSSSSDGQHAVSVSSEAVHIDQMIVEE